MAKNVKEATESMDLSVSKICAEEHIIHVNDREIYGLLYYPEEVKDKYPLVILAHGFGGTHKTLEDYAQYCAAQGFLCYNLDFCGGSPESMSSGTTTDMSVLTEIQDLNDVLDDLKKRDDVDADRIFLLGTSQGGFVSTYVASKRPDEIRALCLFYPAFVLQDEARERADKDGNFPDFSIISGIKVSRKYNEDATAFDIYEEMRNFPKDVLIVHGKDDAVVPIAYSERAEKTFPSAKLIKLAGQGHGFKGDGRVKAVEEAVRFFKEHL